MEKDKLKDALMQLDKETLVNGFAAFIRCLPLFSFMNVVAKEQDKTLDNEASSLDTTIPEQIIKIIKQLDFESLFKI